MHKELLLQAFEEAKKEISHNKVSPRAQHLSEIIFEYSREQYGEKTLREKYNCIINDSKKEIRLKKHAENALSQYLGHKNYSEFVKKNGKEKNKIKLFINNNKITLTVSLIIILGVFVYNYITRERWMIWQEDHYEEVDFDIKKYSINQLKYYKEDRRKFFRKIDPSCDYKFFNSDNTVKVWYGKNYKKELEYFTALGLHPETGKTLRPITDYMINRYICIP